MDSSRPPFHADHVGSLLRPAKYVALENPCLSPQCGFASSEVGKRVSEDDQRRKLELVVEVAREVWG